MERQACILLVEDDPGQRRTLAGFLRKQGYGIVEAGSAAEAEQQVEQCTVDLLLTDFRLGGTDGVTLLQSLKVRFPDLQAVVITAYGTLDDAVRAIKAGAYDFIAKPIDLDRLETLVQRALERVQLAQENRGLRAIVQSSGAFAEMIGESEKIIEIKEMIGKVAHSKASILILGESGTGKEILARAIHRTSDRREQPFITVNCAALSENLIESELFGHERGAFTGAVSAKKGRFELAHGGTLFLDEVGDIPLPLQVKLLNVLQTGQFERVGGQKTLRVDVRLVAATNRDLEARIGEGLFREDLYYRLNVVSLTLPPLRQRNQDIPLLVNHFLQKHADLNSQKIRGVQAEVMQQLCSWPFYGNVRELENWIERAVVLSDDTTLGRVDFPPQLFAPGSDVVEPPSEVPDIGGQHTNSLGLEQQVANLETDLIRQAMASSNGNKSAAARVLKISERAIRYKIRKYGLTF